MPIALFSYLSLDLGHVMQEYSKEQKKEFMCPGLQLAVWASLQH